MLNTIRKGENSKCRISTYIIILGVAIFRFLDFSSTFYFILPYYVSNLLFDFLGAALFPLKRKLSILLNGWIEKLEKEEIPILVGVCLAPLNGLDLIGKCITVWIIRKFKFLLGGICTIISLRLILYFAPREFFVGIWNFIVWSHTAFGAVLGSFSISIVILILVAYISLIYLLWKPEISNAFMFLGQGLWVLVIAYLSSFLGALQVPAFMLMIAYGFIGIIYDMKKIDTVGFLPKLKDLIKTQKTVSESDSKDTSNSSIEHIEKDSEEEKDSFKEKEVKPSMATIATKLQSSESRNKLLLNVSTAHRTTVQPKTEELDSDVYFKVLFYGICAAILWKHVWIMFLCLIPVSVYVVKITAHFIGLTTWLDQKYLFYSTAFSVRI